MKRSLPELIALHENNKHIHPYATTDVVLEYHSREKSGIVLIERKNPPYGIALPGGFCEVGLSFEENACKEVKEETGLDAFLYNPGHPHQYSDPDRDPRGHMVSNTFYGLGKGTLEFGSDAKGVAVYTLAEMRTLIEQNALAFDHAKILSEWIKNRGAQFEHERILQQRVGGIGLYNG